ncbi:MAG: type III-B CRISPR module RAMP protein Cmr4 [Leptothrix ochracea]|uniref:type III-B CRISPR module RAMP protein Cmr4 n=1 Tax=Leptothrix ochracea TaxID=735331 RepID=UPI0034E2D762
MFNATRLVFYYAVSPIHMGAGSAIGAIDSPIQREVHTQHPMFAGSGIKGALRHHFNHAWVGSREVQELVPRIFGPDKNASDFAGALSIGDAQLVALPVRSLKNGFAYVTSPLALARLQRLARQTGIAADWSIPTTEVADQAMAASDALLHDQPKGQQLILEAFEFNASVNHELKLIANWLAQHALPNASQTFFANKLKTDLILLNDTDFAHFAKRAMVVEPHVRINDESGTTDDGGLFYVENLPPETLMVGLAQASVERFKKDARPLAPLSAEAVLTTVFDSQASTCPGIAGRLLQIGGDASTGRGLVLVQPV